MQGGVRCAVSRGLLGVGGEDPLLAAARRPPELALGAGGVPGRTSAMLGPPGEAGAQSEAYGWCWCSSGDVVYGVWDGDMASADAHAAKWYKSRAIDWANDLRAEINR